MNSKLLTLALLIDISEAFDSINNKNYFVNYNDITAFLAQPILGFKVI